MDNVTEDDIGNLLTGMAKAFDDEYRAMSQDELEQRWFFEYDPAFSVSWNIYKFHDCLGLYSRSCRKWEEIHNGHSCVVERVRDTYLLPKIREFEATLREHMRET